MVRCSGSPGRLRNHPTHINSKALFPVLPISPTYSTLAINLFKINLKFTSLYFNCLFSIFFHWNVNSWVQVFLMLSLVDGSLAYRTVPGTCMLHAESLQSCPTLCDPMDCSSPGSSVYGILQTWILEWVAMPFSRGSSLPRDLTHISSVSCISRWILYH